jgi:hypothetical protein
LSINSLGKIAKYSNINMLCNVVSLYRTNSSALSAEATGLGARALAAREELGQVAKAREKRSGCRRPGAKSS